MTKTNISVISFALSIIVAWMMFPMTTGFPMVTFSILFTVLSSLIYIVKKDKLWIDSVLYFGVLSLSFFTVYRANEFLLFLDFILRIFFISVMLRPFTRIRDIFHLLLSPVTVFFNTAVCENIFKYTFTQTTIMKRKNYLKAYAPTAFVTIVVMLITIPLLASANPLFNNFLQQTFKLLYLEGFWRFLTSDSLVVYILRLLALLFFAYMIPRSLSVAAKGVKEYVTLPVFSINYLIPKIVMSVILVAFFVTQIQLYFATPEVLQSLGYTNSRLTNEVFMQVSFVAFIVLLLTYLDTNRKKWNTFVAYFLLLEALFLIGIAFKSVYDYSFLYGLTEKRLWGYASMTWLTGAVGIYVYHFVKLTSVNTFIKHMLAFSVAVIFAINLLNFDYLIYHKAKPSTQAGIDYNYISRLSVDAHHYKEVLPKLMSDIQANTAYDEPTVLSAMNMIADINYLRDKYGEHNDLNTFNYAEYEEYKATKEMNILEYEKIISDKKQQQTPPVFTP